MQRYRRLAMHLLGPMAALLLLVGMARQQSAHLQPEDFDAFHADVKLAIDGYPLAIGPWVGKDVGIPPAADKLLKPNAVRSIQFSDVRPMYLRDPNRSVNFTVVQCKRTADMLGHYPPICYPAFGRQMIDARECRWQVADKTIVGMEYRFERLGENQTLLETVYNFIVVPKHGVLRDMRALRDVAEHYEQRYYGAAQFQLVFVGMPGNELSERDRDEIFTTLLAPALPAIERVTAGDLNPPARTEADRRIESDKRNGSDS